MSHVRSYTEISRQSRSSHRSQNSPSGRRNDQSKTTKSKLEKIRFKRKDFSQFRAQLYVTGTLSYNDVLDMKEVFDAYDTTGMGVLLPNDIKLLLSQNGYLPNRKTIYQIMAEFDTQETGGISFQEFMKAMAVKPNRQQSRRQVNAVFKTFDRDNKNYLTVDDLRQICSHLKEEVSEDILAKIVSKASSGRNGRLTFQDFYGVMMKTFY